PEEDELTSAIRATLRILDLAPDRVTVPLLGAVTRAVIGGTDFSLHLTGPTGMGKSELAALGQQHYGAHLDARPCRVHGRSRPPHLSPSGGTRERRLTGPLSSTGPAPRSRCDP